MSDVLLSPPVPQEYFDAHKNNSVIENWTDDNIYVNHEASRCGTQPAH